VPAEPVLLTGPPDNLRATVSLENASDKRISLRGLVLRRAGADDLAVRFGAILPPASSTTVPLSIALPVTTPPGEYGAQIEIAGQTREATLRVETKISARLTPGRILAAPGPSTVELRLANEGNVDIPLARTTRGRTTDDGPDWGDDVVLELAQPLLLQAGDVIDLAATVVVPDGLDPTRRHEAAVPVGVCDLIVIVLPRDVEDESTYEPSPPSAFSTADEPPARRMS